MDVAIFATLKKLLGTKTDTGGSATDGTVNGKLNAVITNTAASTSANASGTLSQKLTYIISTLIGGTGTTGGSATAGTIMSKLNALLTSWTSTRAGYVDTINTNTATNNTASSTGVLSQKLSYLVENQYQKIVHSDELKTTLISAQTSNPVQTFISPYSGSMKVSCTAGWTTGSSSSSSDYAEIRIVDNVNTTKVIGYYKINTRDGISFDLFIRVEKGKTYRIYFIGNKYAVPLCSSLILKYSLLSNYNSQSVRVASCQSGQVSAVGIINIYPVADISKTMFTGCIPVDGRLDQVNVISTTAPWSVMEFM